MIASGSRSPSLSRRSRRSVGALVWRTAREAIRWLIRSCVVESVTLASGFDSAGSIRRRRGSAAKMVRDVVGGRVACPDSSAGATIASPGRSPLRSPPAQASPVRLPVGARRVCGYLPMVWPTCLRPLASRRSRCRSRRRRSPGRPPTRSEASAAASSPEPVGRSAAPTAPAPPLGGAGPGCAYAPAPTAMVGGPSVANATPPSHPRGQVERGDSRSPACAGTPGPGRGRRRGAERDVGGESAVVVHDRKPDSRRVRTGSSAERTAPSGAPRR